MNKKTILISIGVLILSIAVGYTMIAKPFKSYDENSWKTMIPESCQSFFDGCNYRQRPKPIKPGELGVPETTTAYCTKYRKPYCMDKK